MASKQLGLAKILQDPIIKKCILWFEVGLELGLPEYELNIIKTDHPNDTKTCTREMWSLWLRDGKLLDLEEVYKKIRLVEGLARAQNRKKIEDDDETAEFAILHLEKSIKEFKRENEKIAEDHRNFVYELTCEKDWLFGTKEWEKEWRQGETAIMLDNLKEATEVGSFRSSEFVQEFFQQKHMTLEDMSTLDIEYHLYRELLQIEVEQSKIFRGCCGQRNEHDKRVQDLLQEIKESESLITKRVKTYETIMEGLRRLGIDQSKIDKLDEEIENVRITLEECTKARKECDKVYKDGNHNLQQSRFQIQVMLGSFKKIMSHVEHTEEQLRLRQAEQESLLAKVIVGAANGARAGNRIIPIIGIIPGGFAGGVYSLIKGLFEDNEHLRRTIQDSIDNNKRMIRNCGEILGRANTESEELRQTLEEDND